MVQKPIVSACTLWALLFVSSPATSQPSDRPVFPPLGNLVNVHDHLVHLYCTGAGTPTVILEAGTGGFSFDWSLVQPEVAKFARVCSYDRAGHAWSELGPQPRTKAQLIYELHTLLSNARVSGPYLLVGHSGAGYLVRLFQASYADQVVGMVLAECGHENSLAVINGRVTRIRELSSGGRVPAVRSAMSERERSIPPEVLRQIEQSQRLIGKPVIDGPYDKLPTDIQRIRLWALAQPEHLVADDNPFEGEELAALYVERLKREHPLGDLPLIVLHREIGGYRLVPGIVTADLARQMEEERIAQNQDLVGLSTNSAHIIARNSGHDIHLDRPELVVEAIKQVFEAARRHTSVKNSEVVK